MSRQIVEIPDVLKRVQAVIGDALIASERAFDRELASENPFVTDIHGHSRRFRGKRLRPMLLLLTAEACGGIRDEHITLAAVVEMIHTATLVHDDVLDDADLRRHVATVNSRWNNSTSVLFGDYLFTHAFHLAAATGSTTACRLIGRATNVVCEGELTQIRQRGNLDLSEAEYVEIVGAKTGELCAVACELGAEFARVPDQIVDSCREYGRALGIAFQIADDVLDLVGDETQTGKSLGSDLAQQKMTLPLIYLMQNCDSDVAARTRELLAGNSDPSQELFSLMKATDALAWSQQRADTFARGAAERLSGLPSTAARRLLSELAQFSVHRVT
jgi:octaprenyl-diphosphate synthase